MLLILCSILAAASASPQNILTKGLGTKLEDTRGIENVDMFNSKVAQKSSSDKAFVTVSENITKNVPTVTDNGKRRMSTKVFSNSPTNDTENIPAYALANDIAETEHTQMKAPIIRRDTEFRALARVPRTIQYGAPFRNPNMPTRYPYVPVGQEPFGGATVFRAPFYNQGAIRNQDGRSQFNQATFRGPVVRAPMSGPIIQAPVRIPMTWTPFRGPITGPIFQMPRGPFQATRVPPNRTPMQMPIRNPIVPVPINGPLQVPYSGPIVQQPLRLQAPVISPKVPKPVSIPKTIIRELSKNIVGKIFAKGQEPTTIVETPVVLPAVPIVLPVKASAVVGGLKVPDSPPKTKDTVPVLVSSKEATTPKVTRAKDPDCTVVRIDKGIKVSCCFPIESERNITEITVRPTDPLSTYRDSAGDACKCVPYYLCDTEMNAKYIEDPTLTGFGLLDVRFGTSDCQESIERCCKIPKINTEVKPLKPNASRLKGCGYRNVNGLDFTVSGDGNEAQFGEFPWVVAILDASTNHYHGVGVLIHPQVVMTGAHIIFGLESQSFKVRAGEWDTQTEKERLPSQERPVKMIQIRPDYQQSNVNNDLALLRLEKPIELADHINVACLPEQDESFDGSKDCIANGWGKEKFGRKGSYAVILKKVEINTVPNPVCNQMLKNTRLGHYFRLHESFMCAGGEEGKDTCQGDGGAPLVCPVGDNRYKLSGLVSWGIGCGQENVPAVYTRVSMFRNWVDDVMSSWGFDISGYKM